MVIRVNTQQRVVDVGRLKQILPPKVHSLLSQVQAMYEGGDINGVCRVISQLEPFCKKPAELLPLFHSVCHLALRTNNYFYMAEYSLKSMPLADNEHYESSLGFLAKAAVGWDALEESQRSRIKGQLLNYLGNNQNQQRLMQADIEKKRYWMVVLETMLPNNLLKLQLSLSWDMFNANPDQIEKARAAMAYTLAARRVLVVDRRPADVSRVRQCAEYALDNFGHELVDREKSPDLMFDTFLADLVVYNLFDLVKRAGQVRKVEENEAAAAFLRLCDKYQASATLAFVGADQDMKEIEDRNASPALLEAMSIMAVKICRQHFESIKQQLRLDDPWLRPKDAEAKVLLSNRLECARIREKIELLRLRVLQKFSSEVAKSQYFNVPLHANDFGGSDFSGCAIQAVGSNAMELFIVRSDTLASVKIIFPFKYSSSGKAIGIENHYGFDGLSNKEQKQLPLFWDLLILHLLVNSSFFEAELEQDHYVKARKEIENMVAALGKKILEEENQARLATLEKEFLGQEIYRENELEMGNCLALAKSIFAAFVKKVEPFFYILSNEDFLVNLVSVIRVLEKKDQDGTAIPLELSTVNGETINLSITPSGKVFPSINPLLEKYIAELFFSACAKKLTDYDKTEPGTGQAPIIASPDDGASTQHRRLRRIYAAGFPELVKQKGLLAFPWLYKEKVGEDEVLFHPIPDQSPTAKQKLLADKGQDNIFIPQEPFGSIRVLPVSRRKKNGQWKFHPEKRNPLRERQKDLLKDPRKLPKKYRLYIKTTFSDGTVILTPYKLRDSQSEILSDQYYGQLEREIAAGDHMKNPKALLKGSSGKKKHDLEKKIDSGEATITRQESEVFDIDTTYHRPPMVTLKSQIEKGLPLQSKGE